MTQVTKYVIDKRHKLLSLLYTNVIFTKSAIYKCHNKIRLKHHLLLYSKLITYLKVFLITMRVQ